MSISRYELRSGVALEYDSRLVLPPDEVSLAMGLEAAAVANSSRFLTDDPNKIIDILELGIGTGICIAGLIEGLTNRNNLVVRAIDYDPYCVNLAQTNLARLAYHYGITPEMDIFQGDWFDEELWKKLAESCYHIIFFNPPYLAHGEAVRAEYTEVPQSSIYTNDALGLEHYREVYQHLPQVLNTENGSTILVRHPRLTLETFERNQEYSILAGQLMRQIPGGATSIRSAFQIGDGRFAHYETITRCDIFLPPHKNPPLIDQL